MGLVSAENISGIGPARGKAVIHEQAPGSPGGGALGLNPDQALFGQMTEAQRRLYQERAETYPIRVPYPMNFSALVDIANNLDARDGPFSYGYELNSVLTSINGVENEPQRKQFVDILLGAKAVHTADLYMQQAAGTFGYVSGEKTLPENVGYLYDLFPGTREALHILFNEGEGGFAEFLQDKKDSPLWIDGTNSSVPYTTRYEQSLRTTKGTDALQDIITKGTFIKLAEQLGIKPNVTDEEVTRVGNLAIADYQRQVDKLYPIRNELLVRRAQTELRYQSVRDQMDGRENEDRILKGLNERPDTPIRRYLTPEPNSGKELRVKNPKEVENGAKTEYEVVAAGSKFKAEVKYEKGLAVLPSPEDVNRQQTEEAVDAIPDEKSMSLAHRVYLVAERAEYRSREIMRLSLEDRRMMPGLNKGSNYKNDTGEAIWEAFRLDLYKDAAIQPVGAREIAGRTISPDPEDKPVICTAKYPSDGQAFTSWFHFMRDAEGVTIWRRIQEDIQAAKNGKENKIRWGDLPMDWIDKWFFMSSQLGNVPGSPMGIKDAVWEQKSELFHDKDLLKNMRQRDWLLRFNQLMTIYEVVSSIPLTAQIAFQNNLDARLRGIDGQNDRWQLDRDGNIVDTLRVVRRDGQLVPISQHRAGDIVATPNADEERQMTEGKLLTFEQLVKQLMTTEGITEAAAKTRARNEVLVSQVSDQDRLTKGIRSIGDIEMSLKFLFMYNGIARMGQAWQIAMKDEEKPTVSNEDLIDLLQVVTNPDLYWSPTRQEHYKKGAYITFDALRRCDLGDILGDGKFRDGRQGVVDKVNVEQAGAYMGNILGLLESSNAKSISHNKPINTQK